MEIKKAVVVGAGTMGAGVGQLFAQIGVHVTVADTDVALADKGRARVAKGLDRLVAKEKITAERKEEIMSFYHTAGDLEAAREADIVIESVFEDLAVKQDVFKDGAQTACTGFAFHRLASHRAQRLFTELDFRAFHFEQFGVLLGERILRFRQDTDQGLLVEFFQRGDHWQTPDEFGDQAKLDEIFRFHIVEDLTHVDILVLGLDLGGEPDTALFGTALDDFFQTGESTTDNEQDIGGVDLQEFLLRVFAPTLRRH